MSSPLFYCLYLLLRLVGWGEGRARAPKVARAQGSLNLLLGGLDHENTATGVAVEDCVK